jgi:hypothetical protein
VGAYSAVAAHPGAGCHGAAHSTINLTLDIYSSHVIQALNQEAADAIDRVFAG